MSAKDLRTAFEDLNLSAGDQSLSVKDPNTAFMYLGSDAEASGPGTKALGPTSMDQAWVLKTWS